MEEKNNYYDILNKIFICLIIIIALLSMNLIFDVANGSSTKLSSDDGGSSTTENSDTIEGMNSVDAVAALKLFDSKDPQVIYFGRPDCGACTSFLPTLKSVQEELEFTTNYVNINLIANDSDLQNLLAKMDITTEVNLNGEDQQGTFGDFYGVTPTVIVVEDGKMKAGIIGAKSEKDYTKFLNENGIK